MFEKIKAGCTKAVSAVKKGCAKIALGVGLATAGSAASMSVPTAAKAAAMVDYSGLSTSVTTELTAALTVVVPLAGTILAAFLGWKFVKRFLK